MKFQNKTHINTPKLFACFKFAFNFRVKWETEHAEQRAISNLRIFVRVIFNYDIDSEVDPERLQYLYIYTILIVVVLYLVFQRALALFCFCLKASRRIHEKLFHGVTCAKMYFFNNNSSGRIINRFSKDINDIDYYLPTVLYDSILVRFKLHTNHTDLKQYRILYLFYSFSCRQQLH